MELSKLKIPEKIVDVLRKDGITELNEPQALAVKKGLLDRKNLVVASPTASGKTLIAELAIIKNFLDGQKSVYLVPLKALASEKYEDFVKKYKSLGMRIAISTGDYDSSDEWLGSYDLVILSNEKMDSILRHNVSWIRDVTLIITDEVHLMDDVSRGPALEMVLTKLRTLTKSQIIALSATIVNANEIAKWLQAELVYSEYRPIKLEKGVLYQDDENYVLDFLDFGKTSIEKTCPEGETELCKNTLSIGKQALVFVGTRRSAEAAAERLSENFGKSLTDDDRKNLLILSEDIESALYSPTKQCRRLAKIVSGGVAFHHAGLIAKQRKIVEDGFRSGLIKFIVATPTLAFGLNLPAYRVIIRDTKRFDSENYGSSYIPNFEVQQMMGRAGRPKYDREGQAILIAKSDHEAEDLKERYILGELEPIYSKLSVESVLRMHVLALVASETTKTKKDLEKFFERTFFAHQYGDINEVMQKIEKILEELRRYNFILVGEEDGFISSDFTPAFSLTRDAKLRATKIGKRVAQLYIDPLSAKQIIDNLDMKHDLSYMTVINQCSEMYPLIRAKKADNLDGETASLKIKIPDVWDIEYEDFLDAFKTSVVFKDWISEMGEDKLLDKYNIAPGDLYNKTLSMEWMLYSARELALILEKKDVANALNKLRLRVKYGVKEELLQLIEFRGIGRARARALWRNDIKTATSIKAAPKEKLEKILGPKIASDLLAQLDADREDKFRRIKRRDF